MKPTFYRARFRGEEVLLVGVEGSPEGALTTPHDYRTGGPGVGWLDSFGVVRSFGAKVLGTRADLEILEEAPDPTADMDDAEVESLLAELTRRLADTMTAMAEALRREAARAQLN